MIWKIPLAIFLLVVLVTGGAIGFFYLVSPDRYNVMIVGSDQRGTEPARSDVLMVFSIPKDPEKEIVLLTIPRDSRVPVEGHDMQKITHAYGYDRDAEAVLGNIELTTQTVEQMLDIEIDASVEFTFNSFVDFVDDQGGIQIRERFVDGEKALWIVRNRARDGGDFARTEDQRDIFKGLMHLAKSPSTLKATIDYFVNHPESRVTYSYNKALMFGYGLIIAHRGIPDFASLIVDEVVPGEDGRVYTPEFNKELYYWIVDEEALETLVDEKLRD